MKKVHLYEEFVSEASLSQIHKAAKNGSYPATVVAIENGKVVYQELVETPQLAPAAFNMVKKAYSNAKLHLEDATGKILFKD